MLKKDYKLYVFDLDGTLADTKYDIALAISTVLKNAGVGDVPMSGIVSAIGGGAKNAVQKITGFKDEELNKYVELFIAEYDRLCTENTGIYEGGEELLKRLKSEGKLLAVVTMKSKVPTEMILKHNGLYDLFDEVVSFDDAVKRKPDPESLNRILGKYKMKPSDALMIGDAATDIEYAKNAGVDSCAALYGYGIPEELHALEPDYTIESLKEL